MNDKEIEFIEELTKEVLSKVKAKGYYSSEDRGYILAEIASYELQNNMKFEDAQKRAITETVISNLEAKGYTFSLAPEKTEEVETKKTIAQRIRNKKNKKVVTYALAGIILLGGGALAANYFLDKDAKHEVVEPVKEEEETVVTYDVNNKESLKSGMKFILEDAASKGQGEATVAEWLNFMLVANADMLDPSELAYLFTDVNTASSIYSDFHNITNRLSTDTILVENANDTIKIGNLLNDELSKKTVNEMQVLFANINEAILKGDKEAREVAVLAANDAIFELYRTSSHNDITASANLIIMKMIYGAYRMDNGIMDKETAKTIYGTENCEITAGSLFNDKYKELELLFTEKYASMQFYANNDKVLAQYDETVEAIKAMTKPVYVADKNTLTEMQLLATTGSRTAGTVVPTKPSTSSTKTTTTTTTKAPVQTPAKATPKAEIKTDAAGLKQAVSENEAEIKKSAVGSAHLVASVHAGTDSNYTGYTKEYFSKLQLSYNPKGYPESKTPLSDTYKKYYEEAYIIAYKESYINHVSANAKFDGIEYAYNMFNAKKTFTEQTITYDVVMNNRPALMNNALFASTYTKAFNAAALVVQAENAKMVTEAKADGEVIDKVVVIEQGPNMTDVYFGDIPEYAYDANGTVVKVDLSVTSSYYLKDEAGNLYSVNFSKTK